MDGHSQNRQHEREQIIESWICKIVEDGGVTRYDDIHVDRIDSAWRYPRLWVQAAFEAQEMAIKIRNKYGIKFSVVVGFSLNGGVERQGVNFNTRAQFETLFNQTPPSLYLFRLGMEPWVQADNIKPNASGGDLVKKKIDSSIFGKLAGSKDCWYIEFKHHDVEGYSRSVFISDRGERGNKPDPFK